MRRVLVSLLLLSGVPAVVHAQARAGGELVVNTYTTGVQAQPSVASAAGGAFVVTWQGDGQDGSVYGVFGQRFDVRGARAGGEFRVNSYTTGNQFSFRGDLGADRAGNFVVGWSSFGGNYDGNFDGTFARRYTAGGAATTGELRVNSYTPGVQFIESVAVGPHGQFVVSWNGGVPGGGVVNLRLFDSAGVVQGGEIVADTHPPAHHSHFDTVVALAADGRFVVVWEDHYSLPPFTNTLFGRRFDASGAPVGGQFQVNSDTTAFSVLPSVATTPGGGFVVAWMEYTAYGDQLRARRFAADATPLGVEFEIAPPQEYSFGPVVATDDSGRFVVAWGHLGSDGNGQGILARRFDAAGTPTSASFVVNTYTPGDQIRGALSVDAVGNFVVAWHGDVAGDDGAGVRAQRFGGLEPAALTLSDGGNGVLEVGESFTLGTSWRNVNGATQTFQGHASNLTAPTGMTLGITGQATYGPVVDGAVAACGTCFAGTLTGTRTPGHQDAGFDEDITPAEQGQKKPWLLHVGGSFTDVPASSPYYRFVETLLHDGVTAGCTGTTYCPASPTTRAQMAVFVLEAKEGAGYVPTACTTPVFSDVPAASPFCRFVEELVRRAVVNGCGNARYCPDDAVTREQMAIFTLRTLDPSLTPPACTTPVFNDVPASSPFCRWIEELARRGVVAGCGNGAYCPQQPVTREQMGVFIAATFGLTLYGV